MSLILFDFVVKKGELRKKKLKKINNSKQRTDDKIISKN